MHDIKDITATFLQANVQFSLFSLIKKRFIWLDWKDVFDRISYDFQLDPSSGIYNAL